jgi:transglutaminase-like putative cysteine protease
MFIASIPVDVANDFDWSKPVRAEVSVERPDLLLAALYGEMASEKAVSAGGSVRIDLPAPSVLQDSPSAQHRTSSFVIDYGEPSIQALLTALRETHGTQPSVAALVDFTSSTIADKSTEHGWDIASQVARNRAGDCTEHAVLLTALARASSYPARVVQGAAIIEEPGSALVFGHAWAEIYVDGAWRLADATKITDAAKIHYLRTGTIDVEGPGFVFGMMVSFQKTAIFKITLSNPTAD